MSSIDLIQNKLNLVSTNFSLISDNVANINTPGYKRKYIDVQGDTFSDCVEKKMRKTMEGHQDSASVNSNYIKEVDAYIRTDENGVNIDTEVLELNKNNLFYKSLVNLLNGDLTKQKNIISSK